jgi:cytochrome c2
MKWIEHPRAVNPKTAMPELGVTRTEARDMAAYLYSQ